LRGLSGRGDLREDGSERRNDDEPGAMDAGTSVFEVGCDRATKEIASES
jgi:hypothetical protein